MAIIYKRVFVAGTPERTLVTAIAELHAALAAVPKPYQGEAVVSGWGTVEVSYPYTETKEDMRAALWEEMKQEFLASGHGGISSEVKASFLRRMQELS